MKKVLTLATLLLLSGGAFAEEGGGFKPGEAPPPPHQLDSGYKGTEDTKESSVKDVREAKEGQWMTLEGFLIQHHGGDRYAFRDKTGTLNLTISPSSFRGKEFSADDLVRINGYARGEGDKRYLEVKELGEP